MRRMTESQQLLADTEWSLRDFLYWPTKHHYTCGALWIAAASLRDQHGEYKPFSIGRPIFISNDGDTGKSLSTKVMCSLTPGGKVVLNPTSHGLASMISVSRQVPGIEEIDKKLGLRGVRNADMMAIVLGGYQKGATIVQQRNDIPDDVHIHGPMICNGNNASMIMHSEGYQPFRTRAHIFLMEKPPEDHYLVEFDPEIHLARLAGIRSRWAKWGVGNWRRIIDIDESELRMDKRIKTRQKEIWKILYRVAHYVGGEWPERVRAASRAFVLGMYDVEDTPPLSPADELLMEVRACFTDSELFLPTKVILQRIMSNSQDAWWNREWRNPRAASMGLARIMEMFDIEGCRETYNGKQERGYRLDNLDNLDNLSDLDNLDNLTTDEDDPANWDWSEV